MYEILDEYESNAKHIKDWQLFVGPNADYYINAWLNLQRGHRFQFNIWAFSFNVFWLLYRKMYQPAILFLSIFFAEGFLETLVIRYNRLSINLFWWNSARIFVYAFILGMIGNWVYYQHCQFHTRVLEKRFGPKHYQTRLPEAGGTSFWPIIGLILFTLCTLLIQLYFINLIF